ncbi:MAG: hypothetical protein ACOC1K_01845 [Nanoarchaeota archaeon]
MVYPQWHGDVGNIIFEKKFRNKTILLISEENGKVKLIIVDRDEQFNHRKNSINNILKYLRKNLNKKEYLEAERSIFTVN